MLALSFASRKCIDHDESLDGTGVTLEVFQNYSRTSCLLECRANLLLDKCGCLPYYFPDFTIVKHVNKSCDLEGLKNDSTF